MLCNFTGMAITVSSLAIIVKTSGKIISLK